MADDPNGFTAGTDTTFVNSGDSFGANIGAWLLIGGALLLLLIVLGMVKI